VMATRTRIIATALVFWLVFPQGSVTPGRTAPEKKADQETPLHITALRLEADQTKRLITFSGQVRAQYGDSILYTEQLRVYYQPPEAKAAPPAGAKPAESSPLADLGGEKIDRIEAEGQVRFVQEDKVAAGQKAIYYRDQDKVVLLGNPQVWRGENNLKGETITLYLKDNRVVVESAPQKRVEAHLYQAPGESPGVGGLLPGGKAGGKKGKGQRP
jgi:lipopolysaccharide export system protein LptA